MDKRLLNGKSAASRQCQKDRLKIKEDPCIIQKLYDSGLTLKDIGKNFNTTAATVLKFFRDNKLKLRTKSEITKKRMQCEKTRDYLREKSTEAFLRRRKFGTGPEKHFEEWCKNKNIRYKSQWRKIGNKHPYDFLLPDYNLLVEIDGHFWHSKPEQKIKDEKHTKDAINAGYRIVRIDTLLLKESTYEEFLGDYIEFKNIE